MNQEKIIVIDFGGQYNQLVARRVRECHVYCEIYSYRTPIEQIKAMNPKGIILTGGPNSVYEEGAATCSKELFEMGVPVLGLCYGAQLMSHVLGGHVSHPLRPKDPRSFRLRREPGGDSVRNTGEKPPHLSRFPEMPDMLLMKTYCDPPLKFRRFVL